MWYIWQWLQFGGLENHVYIAKLIVRHLGCRHGFLSMQYSKPPIKTFTIFRAIHQILDSPIIPRIRYYNQE